MNLTAYVLELLSDLSVLTWLANQPGGERAIYPSGEAPEGVREPYILWLPITILPQNMLDRPPLHDDARIQLELYASDHRVMESLQAAVRDQIETAHDIETIIDDGKDPTVKLYRRVIQFQVLADR